MTCGGSRRSGVRPSSSSGGTRGGTAVERVNGRFKVFWGVDDGNVIGARRFHAHVGVVLVVHVALARWLAAQPRWEGGSLGQMNLSPIAQALAQLDHDLQPEPEPADA